MYPNKGGKTTRRSAWMNKELLDTLRLEVYRWWKQGQVAWKEYRRIVQSTRNQVRKVKAQIELNLSRATKKLLQIHPWKENQGECGPSPVGDLVTWDMENSEVLSDCSASIFTGKCSKHITHTAEGKGRDWENEEPPTVGDWVWVHLRHLKVHKDLMRSICRPSENQQMKLLRYPSYLRSHDSPMKSPLTGKGET